MRRDRSRERIQIIAALKAGYHPPAAGGFGDAPAVFKKVGDLPSAGGGIERTAKGGLHVAVRQSSAVAASNGYNIELPDGVTFQLPPDSTAPPVRKTVKLWG